MKTSAEVRARLDEIAAAMRAVADGTDTDTDEERLAGMTAEYDSLEAELPAIERREAIIAAPPAMRSSGDGARRAPVPGMTATDPFRVDVERASRSDLREASLDAIERQGELTDEQREAATRLVQRAGRVPGLKQDTAADIARHVLLTGSDEYQDDFYRYLATGHVGDTLARTAMSLTDGNGGYMVPFTLDPTIVLTNNGAINPFRGICRVVQTTTDTWNGVTSAGATAYYGAEAAAVTDGSPTFAQPTITPVRGSAYLLASLEVLQDSNVGAQVLNLIAEAKDRLDESKLVGGGGSASSEPWGIQFKLAATTASRVSATTSGQFGAVDIPKVANALPARHRPNASWLGELFAFNSVRQFDVYGGGSFWTDMGGDRPDRLYGKPVAECSSMPSSIVGSGTNDILIYGDFEKFVLCDRVGVSVTYVPPGFVTNSSAIPTGQAAWVAFWRFGSLVLDTGAFRLLRV